MLEIETRWSDTDIFRIFKILYCYFLKNLKILKKVVLLKKSVDVFRQYKQLLDNKSCS